jgi:hypothetical protein
MNEKKNTVNQTKSLVYFLVAIGIMSANIVVFMMAIQ